MVSFMVLPQYLREPTPVTVQLGAWVGSRAVLDAVGASYFPCR